jgi:S-adenosylmethionine decarboxylase
MHFGEHLMIDGYEGDASRLNDESLVMQSLVELPQKLGMRILGKPVVYLAPENDAKDPGGWSGFAVIMESHISVHTFPKRRFVSIDVYTCRNGLDIEKVKEFFIKIFGLEDIETNFVKRGMKYPVNDLI